MQSVEEIKHMLPKDKRISLETFIRFYEFLNKNIWNELPDPFNVTLINSFATFNYLNMHYYIQDERASNILSIIVRGNLFLDQVFEDYLKCDFAIVNSDGSKVLSGVRLFEGEIPEVQSILKQIVIPYYQQY